MYVCASNETESRYIGFAEPTQAMVWIPGFNLRFEFI